MSGKTGFLPTCTSAQHASGSDGVSFRVVDCRFCSEDTGTGYLFPRRCRARSGERGVILALPGFLACGSAEQPEEPTATSAAPTAVATPPQVVTAVVPTRGVVEATEREKPWPKFIDQGTKTRVFINAEAELPDHWDLHQACCNPGPAASRDLSNNLLIYDPSDRVTIIGDLAKSWEWSDDGLTATFQ